MDREHRKHVRGTFSDWAKVDSGGVINDLYKQIARKNIHTQI